MIDFINVKDEKKLKSQFCNYSLENICFFRETHSHSVTTHKQAVLTIYYHCIIFLLLLNGKSIVEYPKFVKYLLYFRVFAAVIILKVKNCFQLSTHFTE